MNIAFRYFYKSLGESRKLPSDSSRPPDSSWRHVTECQYDVCVYQQHFVTSCHLLVQIFFSVASQVAIRQPLGWLRRIGVMPIHDDVIEWKLFPRYWPFARGIHRWPLDSPHKGQCRGALMFSLICAWTNGWVNNRDAGDSRRHRGHYDVTVMYCKHITKHNKARTMCMIIEVWCIQNWPYVPSWPDMNADSEVFRRWMQYPINMFMRFWWMWPESSKLERRF